MHLRTIKPPAQKRPRTTGPYGRSLAGLLLWLGCILVCHADVITDWDAKATAVASPAALGQRELAIVDLAMFDAVNSIDRHYRPYQIQVRVTGPISPEAAAASAAAAALAALHPKSANDFKAALAEYLPGLAATSEAVLAGRELGEAVALKVVESRANDGATATDPYRPKTRSGVYVPTATMVCPTWPMLRPFALATPTQVRPGPPVSLTSKEWAADYNEIKEYGALVSVKRTSAQTETAKFWLMTGPQAYHPIARQIVLARHLRLVDSARFMAVFAVALTDAYIAVFDAKYHYEFWRPVTAIRNGDIDDNPDTAPDATWQPLDATPMHPEYPCAHCILSSTAATVIEIMAGNQGLPELSLTSPTAPGVTHHWSNLDALTTEVANARIWAGFHYRFSTRVGIEMGHKIGQYVTTSILQPAVP
jgi:hypothetical protein